LQLTGECCVLVGCLGRLNLLPHGCVLRSVEGLVLCVDGVVLGWRGGRFTVIQAVGPLRVMLWRLQLLSSVELCRVAMCE
jgi:hypothetical protein